jgi:DNA polymerase I-like protein with 3'-5' exonuclease and polymerase domains
MTKLAMLELWKEGIIPHLQIHDEVDISVKDKKEANRVCEIMQDCVKLVVPLLVDYELGPSWGQTKEQ